MTHRDQPGIRSHQFDGLPGRRWRWIASIIVALHVAAVVLPPLAFQARGPLGVSPAVETAITPLQKYGQSLYLDRGYAFFAPDPGPSHLFQAAITDADGGRVEELYPNLDNQWPRLLYHRHFMLAEYLDEIYQSPGPPPGMLDVDQDAAKYWVRARARYEHVRQSVVDHLKEQHESQSVAIRRIEHLIPDLAMFIEEPIALESPQLYRVLEDRPVGVSESEDALPPHASVNATQPVEAIPLPQSDPLSSSSQEPEPSPEAIR